MSHQERIALLESLPGETISPAQLSQILGGNPYSYSLSAKRGQLDLPHIWRGRNLRIYKQPLLDILKGGSET